MEHGRTQNPRIITQQVLSHFIFSFSIPRTTKGIIGTTIVTHPNPTQTPFTRVPSAIYPWMLDRQLSLSYGKISKIFINFHQFVPMTSPDYSDSPRPNKMHVVSPARSCLQQTSVVAPFSHFRVHMAMKNDANYRYAKLGTALRLWWRICVLCVVCHSSY